MSRSQSGMPLPEARRRPSRRNTRKQSSPRPTPSVLLCSSSTKRSHSESDAAGGSARKRRLACSLARSGRHLGVEVVVRAPARPSVLRRRGSRLRELCLRARRRPVLGRHSLRELFGLGAETLALLLLERGRAADDEWHEHEPALFKLCLVLAGSSHRRTHALVRAGEHHWPRIGAQVTQLHDAPVTLPEPTATGSCARGSPRRSGIDLLGLALLVAPPQEEDSDQTRNVAAQILQDAQQCDALAGQRGPQPRQREKG